MAMLLELLQLLIVMEAVFGSAMAKNCFECNDCEKIRQPINQTCTVDDRGMCFSSKTRTSDDVIVVRRGCIGSDASYVKFMLSCQPAKTVHDHSIKCCNHNLCNTVSPYLAPRQHEPSESEADSLLTFALIVMGTTLAVVIVAVVVVHTLFRFHLIYRKKRLLLAATTQKANPLMESYSI